MLTRLDRCVRRQIATGDAPAIVVLRLNRDGEALLEIRRKRARRGHSFNLSAIAARLLKLQRGTLAQTELFAPGGPR